VTSVFPPRRFSSRSRDAIARRFCSSSWKKRIAAYCRDHAPHVASWLSQKTSRSSSYVIFEGSKSIWIDSVWSPSEW